MAALAGGASSRSVKKRGARGSAPLSRPKTSKMMARSVSAQGSRAQAYDSSRLRFNVGGSIFETTKTTIEGLHLCEEHEITFKVSIGKSLKCCFSFLFFSHLSQDRILYFNAVPTCGYYISTHFVWFVFCI